MTSYVAKPETLADVADKSPAPQPTRNTEPTAERLCEYDEGAQSGCRRTNTILALEAEFDTFVDPEMYWGYWDQFCQHEGFTYFYKPLLRKNVETDQAELAKDSTNTELQPHISVVTSFFGSEFHSGVSAEFVEGLFRNPPAGFPTLVIETPNFFQCNDLGTEVITIDQLDKALLSKIQSTFVGDVNPLLADLTGKLYLKDGNIFCSDYLAFEQNPSNKLGVMMIAKGSENYVEGNAYFFPFGTLTAEQENAVRSMGLIETELKGEVVIVNL